MGWTTSFWPGMLWLAHDLTGEEAFRRAALSHVDSFADRVDRGIDLDTHDLGFLYTLSCVDGVAADRRRARPRCRAGGGRPPVDPGARAGRHHPGLGRPRGPAPAWPDHHRQPHEHAPAVLGERDHRRPPLRRRRPPARRTAARAHPPPRRHDLPHLLLGHRARANRCAARPSRATPTTRAGPAGRPGASTGSPSTTATPATRRCCARRSGAPTTSWPTCRPIGWPTGIWSSPTAAARSGTVRPPRSPCAA